MRTWNLVCLGAWSLSLLAQPSSRQATTYQVDVNGRPIDTVGYSSSQSATGASSVVTTRNVNGRQVPVESTQDHIVSKDASSTVIDRTVRRYDSSGTAGPADRIRIEERKNPDGSTTLQAVTYRADLNGNLQVVERTTTQTRGTTNVEKTTVVEGASLNGRLAPVQRTVATERVLGSGTEAESTTYRQDVSGNFYAATREVSSLQKSANQETKDSTFYVMGDGRMDVDRRMIGKTVTRPDGSQTEQIDVYARQTASNAGDANASSPRLQEQIVKERVPGPNNTIIETTTSQSRLAADPSKFSRSSQTVTTIQLSTDALGREVRSAQTSVGRADPNGRIVTTDHTVEQSVTKK